jgi:hypothetical protein
MASTDPLLGLRATSLAHFADRGNSARRREPSRAGPEFTGCQSSTSVRAPTQPLF